MSPVCFGTLVPGLYPNVLVAVRSFLRALRPVLVLVLVLVLVHVPVRSFPSVRSRPFVVCSAPPDILSVT